MKIQNTKIVKSTGILRRSQCSSMQPKQMNRGLMRKATRGYMIRTKHIPKFISFVNTDEQPSARELEQYRKKLLEI